MNKIRCRWCTNDPLYISYHDTEWGVPLYSDQALFELLILEGMQAGLSWLTILKKREAFRAAFSNFDAEKIVQYDSHKKNELLVNAGIIRNRLKINATIKNATAFLELKKTEKSFSDYLWQFVNAQPIQNHWADSKQVPAKTDLSDMLSKDLKKEDLHSWAAQFAMRLCKRWGW